MRGFFAVIAPGLLVAATGVGAGDLATASLAGSKLGTAIMWAVVLGAFIKFVLNEGLARWQLATGQTLLEGAVLRLGRPVVWVFTPYLFLWTFFVGSALMSACGIALHAMIPAFEDANQGKFIFGFACSVLGVVLVRLGGFRLFEILMRTCIAVMFVTVIVTAVLLKPDVLAIIRGLTVPRIPLASAGGVDWTIALMGGVGGTLTVLCYGYWIREKGRTGPADLKACRIDLAFAYIFTAMFALAMIVIASGIEVKGKGASLIVQLAAELEKPLGPWGKWTFLIGAFGALFSSLIGVWQAVPYIFADYWYLTRRIRDAASVRPDKITMDCMPYRIYLAAIAIVPVVAIAPNADFSQVQKFYSIIGAMFMPMLAVVLLIMNGRSDWVGASMRNRIGTIIVLVGILIFFATIGFGKGE